MRALGCWTGRAFQCASSRGVAWPSPVLTSLTGFAQCAQGGEGGGPRPSGVAQAAPFQPGPCTAGKLPWRQVPCPKRPSLVHCRLPTRMCCGPPAVDRSRPNCGRGTPRRSHALPAAKSTGTQASHRRVYLNGRSKRRALVCFFSLHGKEHGPAGSAWAKSPRGPRRSGKRRLPCQSPSAREPRFPAGALIACRARPQRAWPHPRPRGCRGRPRC